MDNRTPSAGYILANTVMAWLTFGVAAIELWPIYQSPAIVLALGVALALGSLIAILGALFRWPAPLVLGITVVGYAAVGVPIAVPAKATDGIIPTWPGLIDLFSGVALGWKQLVTITLPVGEYEALLVPFFALTLVLVVLALSLALRSRAGDAAALGPVILFLAAIAFGSTVALYPAAITVALVVLCLLWIVWRRGFRRRAAIRALSRQISSGTPGRRELRADNRFVGFRTLVAAVVILALATGTAVAASAALPPQGGREVLRSVTTQPFEPRDYVSPLSGFRSYWKQPKTDDVMLTVRGLPSGGRIRIATLDTYDGVVYSVGSPSVSSASGSFTRVPSAYDQSGVSGRHVSVDVTVEQYSGVWLPTVGKLETVDFSGANASTLRDDFFYNDTTGTAADLERVQPGDSYQLDAVLPTQPAMSQLASVDPGSASVPDLTTVPAQLNSTLNTWISGAQTPGQRLVAMLQAIKQDGYVSHGVGMERPSRSGHAVDRINELLTSQPMIGDAEQYSVTAALMARELGFPARVVMGFVAPKGSGTLTIRGSNVSAWIEVDTAQYGWVTIDPNPPTRPIPVTPPKNPNDVARPQTVVPPPTVQKNPPQPQTPPDAKQKEPPVPNAFLAALVAALAITGWVLLGILVLLSPFIVILVAKARRRTLRRRAASTRARITGGWSEFEDSALDYGFQPPPAATRSEVAATVGATVGGTQPAVLAAVADRATFAPGDPEENEVELVWRSVRDLVASMGEGRTRWQRLRARISVRSLGGYSLSNRFNLRGSRP